MIVVYTKTGATNLLDKHKGCALSIGVFDGVHIGHRRLIEIMKREADKMNLPASVLTFYPHPYNVIKGKNADKKLLICSLEERINRVLMLGVEYVIVVLFTRAFSRLSYRDFFFVFLKDMLDTKQITVGQNFSFGRGACGDVATLEELASHYNIAVKSVSLDEEPGYLNKTVDCEGSTATVRKNTEKNSKPGIISSSLIRKYIATGKVDIVPKFLGYYYSLDGVIVEGFGRGKNMGFPTLNLALTCDSIMPLDGIYVGYVDINGAEKLKAVIFIGEDMVFKTNKRSIEAHIIDTRFDGDQMMRYKKAKFTFLKFIRTNRGFAFIDSLKATIKSDVEYGKDFFRSFCK